MKLRCKVCNKQKKVSLSSYRKSKNHFCSLKCYAKFRRQFFIPWNKGIKWTESSERQKAEKHWNWRKDGQIGYTAIHKWLKITFGKADKCENIYCPKTSTIFQWALLKNKKYLRKRKNFIMLCVRCHNMYDRKKYKIEF